MLARIMWSTSLPSVRSREKLRSAGLPGKQSGSCLRSGIVQFKAILEIRSAMTLVKSNDSDCTRTLINLNQILREMEPALLARLSSRQQLTTSISESVRPILGNQQLIETVVLGLVEKAEENLG